MSLESYKRADGLVTYSYKFFHKGKTYRGNLGTVSKSVAQRLALQAKARIYEGGYEKPAEVQTLNEFTPHFMAYYREKTRASSAQTYFLRLSHHILPFLGVLRLSDITADSLDQYRKMRSKEGASNNTIQGEFTTVSTLLQYAVDVRILPDIARDTIPWFKPHHKDIKILTISEEERLLSAATPRLKPLIRFDLQTGLTKHELLGLTWDDIDWSNREVLISDAVTQTGKGRAIPLNREALEILEDLKGNVRHGRIFGYRSIRSGLYEATTKAGLTGVNCSTLRHTFAYRCIKAGIQIGLVQRWLGHSSLKQTEQYVKLQDNDGHKAIEKICRTTKTRKPQEPASSQMALALEI